MSNENPFSLVKSRTLEGERGQPTSACLPFYTPPSLFFLIFPFFLFSSFFFLRVHLFSVVLLVVAITVFMIMIVLFLYAQ